ncbi:MAG: hypothetical protein RL885_03660 [Planctomycetota bacterium]
MNWTSWLNASLVLSAGLFLGCESSSVDEGEKGQEKPVTAAPSDDVGRPLADPTKAMLLPDEKKHLRNLRQLTLAGENAEAYFSADGRQIIFQSADGLPCDQIFVINVDGTGRRQISDGQGKTTCSYFLPDGSGVTYSTTRYKSEDCPPPPDYRKYGYVWPIYPGFEIVVADPDGSNLRRLTDNDAYDAEATLSHDGSRIVFTSNRNGDLDIYTMNSDGSNVQQLTDEIGNDGGPFFSPDGTKIVYRARHPEGAEKDEYLQFAEQDLYRPTSLEIYVMNADGSEKRQVTDNGAANFAPFWHPDGQRIIFSSNMHEPDGRDFDLYLINEDGTGLERITFNETFDGFPMFNRDATMLVFSSNRNNASPRDTNVFVAEWVD